MQNRVVADGTTATAVEGAPKLSDRVSWGAILAGALVAVAVGVMLNILGAAIGANVVDAQDRSTPDASTFGIAGGVWLLVANLIGLATGGYVAARLSGTSDETDGTLHGIAVWATGFLITAVMLGNIVAGVTSTAASGLSSVVGGAARGAGSAVSSATSAVADQVNPQALVERAQAALRGTGRDVAAMNSEQRNAEIVTILGRRVTGPLAQADRDRLNQLTAAEYGITTDEANRRVQALEADAQRVAAEAEARARAAADATATAAAVGAYWLFAAMLLGAVAAVVGARIGTRATVAMATTSRTYG